MLLASQQNFLQNHIDQICQTQNGVKKESWELMSLLFCFDPAGHRRENISHHGWFIVLTLLHGGCWGDTLTEALSAVFQSTCFS